MITIDNQLRLEFLRCFSAASIAKASRSLAKTPNFRTYKLILESWPVVLLTFAAAIVAG